MASSTQAAAAPSSAKSQGDNGRAKTKTSNSLISGGLSGLASCVILQPLDLLKTRLQQGEDGRSGKLKGARPTILQATKEVLRTDGVLGLWRGTTPTIARNVPGVALYFTALNQLRAVLPNTTAGNLTAGASARTSVGLLLMPMTVVKTRMESSIYHNSNIAVALRDIWRTQGVRGLFAGFWPTTLRDAPTAGLFLVVYERIRSLAVPFDFPKASVDASAGALAAGFSTVATAPFDTVKTRRQLKPQVYTGVIQAFRLISVTEGPAGFFRGVTLRCLRKAASSGIAWSLYEGLIRRFK